MFPRYANSKKKKKKRDVYANGPFKWFKVTELIEKHNTFSELKVAMLIFMNNLRNTPRMI